MSQTIFETDNITVTRFCGPVVKKKALRMKIQITTQDGRYIQMTEADFTQMILKMGIEKHADEMYALLVELWDDGKGPVAIGELLDKMDAK